VPSIPIVDYVSPSVWAWRPGRARAMRRYIDHVLALLPFEVQAHRDLRGPPCTYVGHPLVQQLDTLRPNAAEQARRASSPPVLLVLPGSRGSEIRHHMRTFGDTLGRLAAGGTAFELILPTTPHLRACVEAALGDWPVKPRLVTGEAEKRAAFRIARAALAKSGTVTLELALAGVPMVAAYRGTAIEAWVARRMVRVPTVILANLVIGENVVPEFIQEDCVAANLVPALRDVLGDTPARRRQIEAFGRLDGIMTTGARNPSQIAADVVLATANPSAQPAA
jgi:lipid-A-disaccharide synthase